MTFPPITELTILGVSDPGIPNRERIIIRPTEPVNLGQFGIFIGHKNINGVVTPWMDNFFWFGELIVEPPSWIIIYTGMGVYQKTLMPGSEQIIHSMHWGRNYTVFNLPSTVPVLFRLDSVLIGQHLYPVSKELKS